MASLRESLNEPAVKQHIMVAQIWQYQSMRQTGRPQNILSGEAAVEAARQAASITYVGQKDKAGAPYIDHPARIATSLEPVDEKVVAWWHDTTEDIRMDQNAC